MCSSPSAGCVGRAAGAGGVVELSVSLLQRKASGEHWKDRHCLCMA